MELHAFPAETPSHHLVTHAVRAEMERVGVSKETLAEATGLSPIVIRSVLWGHQGSEKAHRRIEALLRKPFWTPATVFAERLPMIEHFGGDIETMTPAELQALWRKLTGRHQVRRNKALLLGLLWEHFTAAPPHNQAQATKDE